MAGARPAGARGRAARATPSASASAGRSSSGADEQLLQPGRSTLWPRPSAAARTARSALRVADAGQVEPVRRGGVAGLASAARPRAARRSPRACGARSATSSIVPTRIRFMLRMNESASISNSSTSSVARASSRARTSRVEAPVVGLGRREGGEVVRAGAAPPRTPAARRSSKRCGHQQRAAALERPTACGGRGRGSRSCAAAGVVAGGEARPAPPRPRSTTISRGSSALTERRCGTGPS